MLRQFGEWGGGSIATGVLVLALAAAYLAIRRRLRRGGHRRNQERERLRRDFWGWG